MLDWKEWQAKMFMPCNENNDKQDMELKDQAS